MDVGQQRVSFIVKKPSSKKYDNLRHPIQSETVAVKYTQELLQQVWIFGNSGMAG
jgi:hypothetical protein